MPRKVTCSDKLSQDINTKIFERNIPSQQLEVLFNSTPKSTRYTSFHAIDDNLSNVPTKITTYDNFDNTKIFYPGTAKSPWTGYVNNVDTEMTLRNQFFALPNSNRATYVPSSNSNLYKTMIKSNNKIPGNFKLLFNKEDFNKTNTSETQYAPNLFNNHTRVERNTYV
jgi:hypothetical protein